jgi:peroxiredoxin
LFRPPRGCRFSFVAGDDRTEEVRVDAAASGGILQPGTIAPPFELPSGPGQTVSLGAYRGRPVVLVFYPADWSPVCGDQLSVYNEILPEFEALGAQLVGLSVDGPWCHRAYADARKLRFPLASDFEPKGAVARAYGAYERREGVAQRALFVTDGDGVIRWSYLSPMEINPGADGILAAVEELTGKKAPSWSSPSTPLL